LPHPSLLEQPGVFHRDPGRRGQRLQHHFVFGGELGGALFLGQVQVAEDLVAHPHRNTEEAAHRGMVRREADRGRMLSDVGQPDHVGVSDQHSQHAAPLGQVTHHRPLLGTDTDVDEFGQAPAPAEHPQRAVTGINQLHRGLHDALQGGVQLQPGTHRDHRIEQPLQPVPDLDDLGKPVLHFLQQLIQPQPGQPSRRRSRARIARR
jgi:hypothetical protein